MLRFNAAFCDSILSAPVPPNELWEFQSRADHEDYRTRFAFDASRPGSKNKSSPPYILVPKEGWTSIPTTAIWIDWPKGPFYSLVNGKTPKTHSSIVQYNMRPWTVFSCGSLGKINLAGLSLICEQW